MFRNMNRGEHFSGVQTPPSTAAGHVVASLRQPNHNSSLMGMFSVVSRPALSFLQHYLPGRPRNPALADSVSGWVSWGFKQNFVEAESAFLGQLDDTWPGTPHHAHHLPYLQYQHGLPASGYSSMNWLTADSLSELGIRNAAEMDLHLRQLTPVGYLATGFLSKASSQEIKHAEQGHVLGGDSFSSDAVTARATSTASDWWGGLWGTDDSAQGLLSNLSSSKEGTVENNHNRNVHCRQPECGTKAAVTMPTELFVQCNDGRRVQSFRHKEEPTDNGSLQMAIRTESLPLDHRETVCISSHIVSVAAVTACSELAVLTPDQDNGYSSLEEEHSTSRLYMLRLPCEELQGITERKETDTATQGSSGKREPEREASEEREVGETAATGGMEGEEEVEDSDVTDSEEEETASAPPPSTPPQCSNKAIAYIMGGPCSDDSQSDDSLSDDDDGFDSDGSSEFSDSEVLDEDDDEEDVSDSERRDSETERLWNSLCQSRDPYNPQNFTAPLYTSPRTILSTSTATVACSLQASPPEQPPSPFPSSPSPAEEFGSGDESSSSEVDEAESLRLWNSFSSSSDPYSPFNFQVPLRTREPTGTGAKAGAEAGAGARCKRSSKTTTCSPRHEQGQSHSPPQYRNEAAEERLDSGFSETLSIPGTTTMGCVTVKRVCFCDTVEEFYASEDDEDRCGPWEELARDRARFLRRVQDVEDGIGYVLSTTFRVAVYQRLQHHN
uniref:Protein phosphatase 1 regulatory subunit 15A/B C-terminal domain-containing protein n=1 Tax=Hucho hucho TaxID=62062 RepID=A0A4W5PH10_9TELE